jgi:hypothetical protein
MVGSVALSNRMASYMTIGTQIANAFNDAKTRYSELQSTWIRISYRVGSRLIDSLLPRNIQREGDVDILLRCMEDEAAQDNPTGFDGGVFGYQKMLSEYWVGGMYEIFRLLRQRDLADTSSSFAEILLDLELLRMPLEKHEIAKDSALKAPVEMVRNPPKNDSTDIYTYDPSDDQRAHIMPFGKSPRGSLTWYVTDVRTGTDRWIERRDLSDRILALWKDVISQNPASCSPFLLYSHNNDFFCLPLFFVSSVAIARFAV